MGRYATALRRFGLDAGAEFYDAHVVADARHEVVALRDMVAYLADDEPELASQIVFGARALAYVERVFASSLLEAWRAGRTSLRTRDASRVRLTARRIRHRKVSATWCHCALEPRPRLLTSRHTSDASRSM